MRYIDEIELEQDGKSKYKVKEILFRKSIVEPFNELWRNGYIDKPVKAMFEDVPGFVRMSEYMNEKDVEEYLKRFENILKRIKNKETNTDKRSIVYCRQKCRKSNEN